MESSTPASWAGALCLTLLLTGCAGGSDDADDPAGASSSADAAETTSPEAEPSDEEPSKKESPEPAAAVVITIEDFEYSDPGPVPAGSEVMVENLDDAAHTVTAEGEFDVTIAPGETGSFTAPESSGTYDYVCTFHAGMVGSLVVS